VWGRRSDWDSKIEKALGAATTPAKGQIAWRGQTGCSSAKDEGKQLGRPRIRYCRRNFQIGGPRTNFKAEQFLDRPLATSSTSAVMNWMG
jgi:hypothetical protein